MSVALTKRQGVPPPARRWAISFADLALLIACTLMLGWRPDGDAGVTTNAAAHPGGRVLLDAPVAAMFLPGEAMLSANGRALLRARGLVMGNIYGRGGGRDGAQDGEQGAGAAHLLIRVGMTGSGGTPRGSARLDAWELAAARTAVIARHVGGMRLVLTAPASDGQVQITAIR